jgi:Flp pilus assembly protein TadD
MAVPYAYYEAMAQEYLHKPAIETFRKALQDSPYNKKILNDLGRIEYVVNHDVEKATAYFEEAIRISPGYAYAYFNLAQLYLQENQKRKAAEVLQQLDLEYKQQQMIKMVWHYHQDETANYYVHDAVPAEKAFKESLLEQTR